MERPCPGEPCNPKCLSCRDRAELRSARLPEAGAAGAASGPITDEDVPFWRTESESPQSPVIPTGAERTRAENECR